MGEAISQVSIYAGRVRHPWCKLAISALILGILSGPLDAAMGWGVCRLLPDDKLLPLALALIAVPTVMGWTLGVVALVLTVSRNLRGTVLCILGIGFSAAWVVGLLGLFMYGHWSVAEGFK